jgi:nucleoside-diphosphate-sugar epimerase
MILITGGTGFIGSHVVEALCARREAVRCLVRQKGARQKRDLPAGVEQAHGELVSGEGIEEALRGVDTVIHLAGVTKALSRAEYYSGNVHGTENLTKAVAKTGRDLRLVYVSSLAAIGPSPNGTPVPEDAEPHPITNYGKSKLEGERIVRALRPEAVIVRPAVVYGPRDTDVFQLFKSIARGFAAEITGGERWVQAIYVKDLVEGLLAAACCPQAAGRAYFLAHAKAISWTELRSVAAGIMRKRPRVLRIPAPLAYAVGGCAELWSRVTRKPGILSREKVREALCERWTCETRRASQELGFDARTSLETGIAETLAWYKEAGWLKY